LGIVLVPSWEWFVRGACRDFIGKAVLAGSLALIGVTGARADEVLPTIDVDSNGPVAPLQQTPEIGKTGTKIENLPASVQIVPVETVREQGGTDLQSAIPNISGASVGGPSSYGFFDRFMIRGLDARIYEDGFSDGDQINGIPHSLNGVERIEALKGPGSSMFGSGPPGGTINIVHFAPSPTPSYGGSLQAGSFGTVTANAFATGATAVPYLNYRIDGLAEHGDGFRSLESQDYELRPQWTLATDDHVFNVAFDLRHIEATPDPQGIIYFRTSPHGIAFPLSAVGSDTKYSSPYDHGNQDIARATFSDTWTVNNVLTLTNRLSYMHRDLDILRNGDGGAIVGDMLTARTMRHQHDLDDDLVYQLEGLWKFDTGSVHHSLLTGVEAHQQWITTHRETASLPNIANVFAPRVPDASIAGLNFVPNFGDRLSATYLGAYATDQIDVTDDFKLRAGIRQDWWNTNLTPEQAGQADNGVPLIPGTTYSRTDTPISWNVGALYHILPGVSPYAGISTSHLANFNSEAAQNGVHAPEDSIQYEAGIKIQAWDDRLTLTGAWFDTERKNVQASLVVGADTLVVFNSQRTRGFEADLELHPTDKWKILANATIQDPELVDNPSQEAANGNVPQGAPRHLFSLWTTYDFKIGNLDGFRVGGGLHARDKVYADALNTEAVPGFVVEDAFVGYYQPTWDVAVGIKNIENRTYFITANGSGGFVADPRTFYVKAGYKF
jgi:iron complex outermembrane receptor protein